MLLPLVYIECFFPPYAGLSFITFVWKVMKNKNNPVNPV